MWEMNLNSLIPFGGNENDVRNVGFQLVLKPDTLTEGFSSNRFRSHITTKYVKSLRDTGCMLIMIEATATGSPNGIFILSRNVKSDNGNVIALCPNQRELQIHWKPHEYPSIEVIANQSTKPIVYNIRVIQP